jgi:hypothetical protein
VGDDPTFAGLLRSLRADPSDALTRAALADRLEESGGPAAAGPAAAALRAGHVPLTDLDRAAVTALWGCRFLPGSFTKRFARTVYARVLSLTTEGRPVTLSPKQYALLWALCRKFRGQIRDTRVLAEAEAVHALREGLPPPPAGDAP